MTFNHTMQRYFKLFIIFIVAAAGFILPVLHSGFSCRKNIVKGHDNRVVDREPGRFIHSDVFDPVFDKPFAKSFRDLSDFSGPKALTKSTACLTIGRKDSASLNISTSSCNSFSFIIAISFPFTFG